MSTTRLFSHWPSPSRRLAIANPSLCRRWMGTERVSVVPTTGTVTPSLLLADKSAEKTKTAAAKHSVAEQMHRALYPHHYTGEDPVGIRKKRWIPAKKTRKIHEKWAKTMSEAGVSRGLSKSMGVPVFQPSRYNIKKTCADAVQAVTAWQTARLDPKAARTRLFSRENAERARVGDILLVRQRTGDPFAGVCINIRRRGIDTAILLRGQLTRVGVEMWFKIYSPLVQSIEVVERARKRARRARLTYMRKAKHDRGSVENALRLYLRQRAALGVADGQKKTGAAKQAAMMAGGKKKKNSRGKKR